MAGRRSRWATIADTPEIMANGIRLMERLPIRKGLCERLLHVRARHVHRGILPWSRYHPLQGGQEQHPREKTGNPFLTATRHDSEETSSSDAC